MTAAWLAAILCVGVMGFAIQRGATCTVAAVDELLTKRRAHRMVAMLEASLWVAGGLALAQLAHFEGSMPGGFAVSVWTVVGGALLTALPSKPRFMMRTPSLQPADRNHPSGAMIITFMPASCIGKLDRRVVGSDEAHAPVLCQTLTKGFEHTNRASTCDRSRRRGV